MSNLIDPIGQRFGKLTVLSRAGKTSAHKALWLCRCDCGNTKVIIGSNLRRKKHATISCGCEMFTRIKKASEVKRLHTLSNFQILIIRA